MHKTDIYLDKNGNLLYKPVVTPGVPPKSPSAWLEEVCFRGTDSPLVVAHTLQGDIQPHLHDFTELVLVIEGSARHDFDGASTPIRTGDCFLVEPGRQHAYLDTNGLRLVNILVRASFMERFYPMLSGHPGYALLRLCATSRGQRWRHAHLSQEELDTCMCFVDDMAREWRGMQTGRTAMLTGMLLELFVRLCRLIYSPGGAVGDQTAPWLEKVLGHMERHFSENVQMRQLRRIAGMSERSFQRHFKTAVGLTPLRYVLHLRIANACRLLREERRPASEVASLCGITDCAYFSRLFKKLTGVSPIRYARAGRERDSSCGAPASPDNTQQTHAPARRRKKRWG